MRAAILFHSLKPSGAFEKRSMHGSCPVIRGVCVCVCVRVRVCVCVCARADGWVRLTACLQLQGRHGLLLASRASTACVTPITSHIITRHTHPMTAGTKYALVKWLHVGRFAMTHDEPTTSIETTVHEASRAPPECVDAHTHAQQCEAWSMSGECYKNDGWMVGTPQRPGACLASCLRCDVWRAHLALVGEQQQGAAASEQGAAVLAQE
jgi:hypothetical protein